MRCIISDCVRACVRVAAISNEFVFSVFHALLTRKREEQGCAYSPSSSSRKLSSFVFPLQTCCPYRMVSVSKVSSTVLCSSACALGFALGMLISAEVASLLRHTWIDEHSLPDVAACSDVY